MIDPERGQELIENKEALRRHLGLDKPVPVRYVIWLREIVQGNFGYSYHNGLPVLSLIYSRFWATMELTTTAIVMATLLGTLFGVIAALRQYSGYDYGLTVASLFGISIPTFFFALMALYVFSARFELLPAFGMYKATDGYTRPYVEPSPPDNARVGACHRFDGGQHPFRPHRYVGSAQVRLRDDRAVEGTLGVRRHRQARLPKRPSSFDHDHHAAVCPG